MDRRLFANGQEQKVKLAYRDVLSHLKEQRVQGAAAPSRPSPILPANGDAQQSGSVGQEGSAGHDCKDGSLDRCPTRQRRGV